jgi:hypothetical protein
VVGWYPAHFVIVEVMQKVRVGDGGLGVPFDNKALHDEEVER